MKRPRPAFILRTTTYILSYRSLSPDNVSISKSCLLDHLLNHMKYIDRVPVESYLVCEQKYSTGPSTIHALLVYPKPKVISIPNHYDYLKVRPCIQVMPSKAAALQYIYNQDPSPLTNIALETPNLAPGARDYYHR